MLYDEESMLLSDSRLNQDSLFHTFSVIVQSGIIFWGSTTNLHQVFNLKKIKN